MVFLYTQQWTVLTSLFWTVSKELLLILSLLPLEVTRSILGLLCSTSNTTIVCMEIPLFDVSVSDLNCGITAVSSLLGVAFKSHVLSAKVKAWFVHHGRRQVRAMRRQLNLSNKHFMWADTQLSIAKHWCLHLDLWCVLLCLSRVLENALEDGAGESTIMPLK